MTDEQLTTVAELAAWVETELDNAPLPDIASRDAVAERATNVLRPAGAMHRFDEIAVKLATWQGTARPDLEAPAVLIFAADHGVAARGVSAYPPDITASMVAAFRASKATITALASVIDAPVVVNDVGVGRPTQDIVNEAALDELRFIHSFEAGRASIAGLEADIVALGEMGIGNTTPAAAVTQAILNRAGVDIDIDMSVGRGTGVDDEHLEIKRDVVRRALKRSADVDDPWQLLRHLGGAELVGLAGAIVEARLQSLPVVLDGYICTAPALVLHAIDPRLTEHVFASHVSAEPGHRIALDHLGLAPLLDLDLRLGEASGAVAVLPLMQMACRAVTDVATFDEWFEPG